MNQPASQHWPAAGLPQASRCIAYLAVRTLLEGFGLDKSGSGEG